MAAGPFLALLPAFLVLEPRSLLMQCFLPQASSEELKASYRRLCMLYHPDKHRDPELKSQAERLFNLVHQAYEGQGAQPGGSRVRFPTVLCGQHVR